MKQFQYVIKDPNGLHARPAGLLVQQAQKYESRIELSRDGKSASLKRLFAVMGMNVKCGETVEVVAEGPDEEAAIQTLEAFFRENF